MLIINILILTQIQALAFIHLFLAQSSLALIFLVSYFQVDILIWGEGPI